MGDNHGNTESLERVVADTEAETFDFVIHVGDFTNGHNVGRSEGTDQLRAVEPYLKKLAERATHGFLYVYGNRDYYGDLGYSLDVGTHIPEDEFVTVGRQRFTQTAELVEENDILVTHGEIAAMLDHFEGRAYFCGHTHTGRYKDRTLNSAFLYRDDSKADTAIYGGYFVVEVRDEPPFDIDLRNFGRLNTTVCQTHQDRGVLIGPDYHECMYCWRPVELYREIASSAYYGLTNDGDQIGVTDEQLVGYALDLFESPPTDFKSQFSQYLRGVDPLGPLERNEDGLLVPFRSKEDNREQ
jgi:predicted phosphodiesterase